MDNQGLITHAKSPDRNRAVAGKPGRLGMAIADYRPMRNNAPATIQRQANGTGLPDNLKSGIENLSGMSMDHVQVHYNSAQPAQLNAHAYAQGSQIHVAPGQEKHLPHEAWHVVQQAQGRVRPTVQAKGNVPVNDDKGLEKEADVMGEKALNTGSTGTTGPIQRYNTGRHVASIMTRSVLQPKWILRNGEAVEVQDDYVLLDGEHDLDISGLQHDPHVILQGGKRIARYDEEGNVKVEPFKENIPTHEDLQEERGRQGKELAKRLLASPDIDKEIEQLKSVATNLEKLAGNAVPKNHQEKINNLFGSTITGPKYRSVIKSQDELTQSESTSAFFNSLNKAIANTKDKRIKEYAKIALRAFSSLRTPTETVNAPLNIGGSLTGQQHPTSRKQTKLPGGSSSHAYSDRRRVQTQVKTFDAFSKDPKTSATTLLLSNLMSAIVSTLNTMSHPNTAENVPDFNKHRQDDQLDQRERIKQQGLVLGEKFLSPIESLKEKPVDPSSKFVKHRKRALSPPRKKGANKREYNDPKKQPKLTDNQSIGGTTTTTPLSSPLVSQQPISGNTTTPLVSSLSVSQPLFQLPLELVNRNQYLRQRLQNLAVLLLQRITVLLPQDTFQRVINQYNSLQQVDATNIFAAYTLNVISNNLNGLYRELGHLINRRNTAGNQGNADNNQGFRLPSLEQYFAECGQMAVHNVIALEQAGEQNDWGNLHQRTGHQGNLAQHGNFANNISEDDIRQLLANAGRQGIPVIGNLEQVQTFIQEYNAAEGIGQLVNLPGFGAYFLQHRWGQTPVQVQEIINVNNFVSGVTNRLNIIINTDSHLELSSGYHWITVRLVRMQNGQIRIFYLDSLQGDSDYGHLFAALRQFIAQAGPVNGQQGQGSGKTEKQSK